MPDMTQQTILVDLKKNLELFHKSTPGPVQLDLQNTIRRLLMKYRHAGGMELETCDFSNLNLSNLNLSNMNFSEATLHNTNFKNAILINASFCGRDRKNLHVINADFSSANCNLTDFHCCDLRAAIFNQHTNMEDMNVQKSRVNRKNLEIFITHARCTHDTQIPRLKLTEISLEDEDLRNLDLSQLYLNRVFFKNADLYHTTFDNSDISGAYFTGAKNFFITQLKSCVNQNAIYYKPTPAQKKRDDDAKKTKPITDFFKPDRKRPVDTVVDIIESPNKKPRKK